MKPIDHHATHNTKPASPTPETLQHRQADHARLLHNGIRCNDPICTIRTSCPDCGTSLVGGGQ